MKKRSGKYSDGFKIQLVAESRMSGTTVSTVSKRHSVSANQIYAWRQDARFQGGTKDSDAQQFVEVAVTPDVEVVIPSLPHLPKSVSNTRIEITLENGRKLSINDGVDADFALELARGLAA